NARLAVLVEVSRARRSGVRLTLRRPLAAAARLWCSRAPDARCRRLARIPAACRRSAGRVEAVPPTRLPRRRHRTGAPRDFPGAQARPGPGDTGRCGTAPADLDAALRSRMTGC